MRKWDVGERVRIKRHLSGFGGQEGVITRTPEFHPEYLLVRLDDKPECELVFTIYEVEGISMGG